jgi:hypothetical protein
VARHIVLAFRMPAGGFAPGPGGTYLGRARSLCARGEALGGRLVAWSAALLAMAWDTDSIEEAILLGTSIREESLNPERAWASGMAEGELEPLAPDGARMQLAWGEALLSAASLARIARAGELLVDGDVRALRAGQLALVGARAATDAGMRVRGWRLDLEHPWKRAADPSVAGADATEPMPALRVEPEASVVDDILEVADAAVESEDASPPPPASARRGPQLADRVRRIAGADERRDATEALAELRRTRARAEGGPAAARCQASLALAMTLAIAGRPEEALLEALDALARAREAQDPRALGACTALLSKLYSGAGRPEEAAALRDSR